MLLYTLIYIKLKYKISFIFLKIIFKDKIYFFYF